MIATGMLPIDKPSNHTSFDVIARLRKILVTKKLGHTGTLDPMATGVLPVLIGRACKAQAFLECEDKEYIADVSFGIATDTQDITGTVVETSSYMPKMSELEAVLEKFTGSIMQVPPMYSAIKSGGKRLYDLARKGIEVERKARNITIHELELLDMNEEQKVVKLRVKCSKGTYVRTLVSDIGREVGSVATLSSLRRTMVAGICERDCLTLSDIEKICSKGDINSYIVPMDKLFEKYSDITLSESQQKKFLNGVRLRVDELGGATEGSYRVYFGEEFLGTAVLESGELRHQILNI